MQQLLRVLISLCIHRSYHYDLSLRQTWYRDTADVSVVAVGSCGVWGVGCGVWSVWCGV